MPSVTETKQPLRIPPAVTAILVGHFGVPAQTSAHVSPLVTRHKPAPGWQIARAWRAIYCCVAATAVLNGPLVHVAAALNRGVSIEAGGHDETCVLLAPHLHVSRFSVQSFFRHHHASSSFRRQLSLRERMLSLTLYCPAERSFTFPVSVVEGGVLPD